MKKIEVSTSGDQRAVAKLLGLTPQSISHCIKTPGSKNHEFSLKVLDELKESRIKIIDKYQKELENSKN
jgi:predicted transcriptional regulator